MTLGEIKKYVKGYYLKYYAGKSVRNHHKGIVVMLGKPGLKHVVNARNSGYTKLKAIVKIPEMIANAVYCNFKEAGKNDPYSIFGYANFKSKVEVESKIHIFRIVVRVTATGHFYYDHAVKVKK